MDPSHARIATELFLTTTVPALVREVATILAARGIPVMPLKGALLQQLVYGTRTFRTLSDVDVLVPPSRFVDARRALRNAGFVVEREEAGGWEVALRRPKGLLELDLHQKLSSTVRSRLDPDDLFRRGTLDTKLFGAAVVLPDACDLYAHLLLHLTLNWLARGNLHHPEDLEAVPEALSLSPVSVARHLAEVGLESHAALVLPTVAAATEGAFTRRLLAALRLSRRTRLVSSAARALCDRSASGTIARRAAGFLLAPSWFEASRDALLKRVGG